MIAITLIKNKLHSFINFIKRNFQTIAVIISMILAAFLFNAYNKIDQLQLSLDNANSNYEYYRDKYSNEVDNNRVLQLTVNQFEETKDSLVTTIKDVQKELKIKKKELLQTQIQKQEIKHDTTIIVKSNDFNVEIKPNTLTSIIINKKDSILNHRIDIKNAQTLFITNKRVYRNNYKNWFIRLLHFDWKKKNDIRYQIHNSNDLIQITDSRMIEIK